jgi:hypothetical protein
MVKQTKTSCIYCDDLDKYDVQPVNRDGKHIDRIEIESYNGKPHGIKCQKSDGEKLTYWYGYLLGYEEFIDANGELKARLIKP